MPRISTDNYDTVASWNGSQDLFVVEQPDGTKVATPAMVKQFMEAGDFEATGEVKDGHGNILADMAKSADVDAEIGDLSQTGLTGDSVAGQLWQLNDEIAVQSVEIDSLKTSNVSACYGTLYKINGLVFLNFTALYNSEMSASNIALSLPSGFKPSSAVYGNGIILKSNGAAYTALVKINANGNVFGDTSTTGNVLSGTIIYKV